ncbi:MAG: enoyl-CoA hydratase/isomerase family protein [Anaerolineales bacterium]|nr:enoyl-CoA hydratase/isomerase family protein [Anaerolineales bacterium]
MSVSLNWVEPYIALIRIERPHVKNALNWKAMEEFAAAVDQAHLLQDLRALIITGAENAFSSGGDLRELYDFRSEQDGRRLMDGMTAALQRLAALPCPTIAAINGPARGGGAEIALACDMRVMSEDADLGMVHINIGISPAWGGGQRILRLVGYSRALEWLTTGHVLSSEEALLHRVANHLAPIGESVNKAVEMARQISTRPPAAVRAIKRMLGAGINLPVNEAESYERSIFPSLWAAEEHHELVEMFFNRKRS